MRLHQQQHIQQTKATNFINQKKGDANRSKRSTCSIEVTPSDEREEQIWALPITTKFLGEGNVRAG
jgi:hypothetical protein